MADAATADVRCRLQAAAAAAAVAAGIGVKAAAPTEHANTSKGTLLFQDAIV